MDNISKHRVTNFKFIYFGFKISDRSSVLYRFIGYREKKYIGSPLININPKKIC